MNIIGFGHIGCEIAKKISEYAQYKVFYIDVGLEGKNCYALTASKTVEEAEKKTPDFTPPVNRVKGHIFFFCTGHEVSGGSILATLEQFKHLSVDIVYVRQNLDLLSKKAH